MPDRRYFLTTLVVAGILGLGWFVGKDLPDIDARRLVYVCAGLFALAVVRSVLLRPILVLRRWIDYADRRGYSATAGRHSEPRMVGEVEGVRFLVAQSTELLGGGGGYYARTVITAAIEDDVPDGLRLYRRDALEWMHHLSGLREVPVGVPGLDEAFMIEGSDVEETRSWVLANAEVLREIREEFPRFILYGSEIDGLPVAAGGASGALTVLVVGRKSKEHELDELIGSATRYARLLQPGLVGREA